MLSLLKTKNIRSAALCAVLLFSPMTFCTWKKPTAQNQALISAGALLAAPVIDGLLRNASTLTSLDGWKNLPAAVKAHLTQSLFAEGIMRARKEDENFFMHKFALIMEYAKQNPVFLVALTAVIANAADSLNTEFDRLKKEANPNLATDLETAQKNLSAAEKERDQATAQVTQLTNDVEAAKQKGAAETQAVEAKLAAAQQEKATADETVARLDEQLRAETERVTQAGRQLAQAQAAHQNCAADTQALQEQIEQLTTQLAAAGTKGGAVAGAPAVQPLGFGADVDDALRRAAGSRAAAPGQVDGNGQDPKK